MAKIIAEGREIVLTDEQAQHLFDDLFTMCKYSYVIVRAHLAGRVDVPKDDQVTISLAPWRLSDITHVESEK